jgi:hypothetical protein
MRSRVPLSLACFGDRKTLIEWTEDPRCKVSLRELRSRIERGWDAESAVTTPSAVRPSRSRNVLAAFGEEKSIADWSRDPRSAVAPLTIAARIQRGWEAEEAISTPVHGKVRPPRPPATRPPHTRRPRLLITNEPISNLDAEAVKDRMADGAELWLAGSSGDRVSLVEHDTTTLISHDVLEELQEEGALVVVCRAGTLVQYGLAPSTAS